MSSKKNISSRLSALRKRHKITLASLGESLGVSNQAVSAWEKGKSDPSIEYILAIADYFDVSTDYLLGRTDDPEVVMLNIPPELEGAKFAILGDDGTTVVSQELVDKLAEFARYMNSQKK